MKILILLLPFILFLSACEDKVSEQRSVASFNGGDTGEDNSELEEVIDEDNGNGDAGIIIDGPQVCYNSGSCHVLVSKSEMTTPEDYVYKNPSSSLGQQYRKPSNFVDLGVDGTSEYVSANFKRSEYMALFKGRYGLLAPHFVNRIQKIRDSLGQPLTVNSGYRGPAYNASIGGATWSRHMYGDALDFKVSGKTPSQLKAYCQAQGASYIQIYSTHIHCDWRNVSLAEEFYPSNLVPVLAKAQTADLNHKSHMDFYENIHIHSEDDGEKTLFSVEVLDAEDGVENLLVEWEVYLNNKKIKDLTAARLQLEMNQPGDYVIQVTVGGYWKKYKVISK